MILKKIFILLAFVCSLFSLDFAPKVFEGKLLRVNEKDGTAVVSSGADVMVGSYGVVRRTFSDKSTSIVASAQVISKDGNEATVKLGDYKLTEQKALPSLKEAAKVGDEVLLNLNYDTALIVAPNEQAYQKAVADFPNIKFIHPDIFAGYLYTDYEPRPEHEQFLRSCHQSIAGLVYFVLDGESFFVDCESFAILKRFESAKVAKEEAQVPFYSHVTRVPSVFFDRDSKQIKDFSRYYLDLLTKD